MYLKEINFNPRSNEVGQFRVVWWQSNLQGLELKMIGGILFNFSEIASWLESSVFYFRSN